MTNSDLPPLALSVRQPWAWAIIHAGKDIENRTWGDPRRRGRIAIHASKGMTVEEYLYGTEFIERVCRRASAPRCGLALGGIIGSVELVDIVTASDSPWFEGPYGFVLRDPQPSEFIPARGALGFFRWSASLR